jgi:hypothetical protein
LVVAEIGERIVLADQARELRQRILASRRDSSPRAG